MERNAVTKSQYSRRETIELNPVTCHRMKSSDKVMVKFKCGKQKQSLMYKRKNLGTKSQELTNLKFSGRLFVSESMSHENQELAYK